MISWLKRQPKLILEMYMLSDVLDILENLMFTYMTISPSQ